MMVHSLKCRREYFQLIRDGAKTSEFRRNDRGYVAEDILELSEWDPITECYTGRWMRRRVSLVTDLGPVGAPGYVLMEIRPEWDGPDPSSPGPDHLVEALEAFGVRLDLVLAELSKVVREMQERRK